MERKKFEIKEASISRDDGGRLHVQGYASVFDNVDSHKDAVLKGAYLNTIATNDGRIKVLYGHNSGLPPVAVIEHLEEDEKGLAFHVIMNETTLGKDTSIVVEDGTITEMSIGYSVVDSETVYRDGVKGRILKELHLLEFSFVPWASNGEATITSTHRKSANEIADMTDAELEELKTLIDNEVNNRFFTKFYKSYGS